MNTFAELLAAHRADATADLLAPLADVAHVASLVVEGLDAYEAATGPDDKALIGPFVQSIAAHREGLLSKAAAAAALDESLAGLRSTLTPPAATPDAPVAQTASLVATPGTLTTPGTETPANVAPVAKVASFVAVAGQESAPMGTPLDDTALGLLWSEAAKGLSGKEGTVRVASLRYIDEACPALSSQNSMGRNAEILRDGTADLRSRNAKTAAANSSAGFAGPAEYNRAIPFASLTDRPILAAMRRVPIKGVIKHYRSAGLTQSSSGATVWTVTNQQALDPADGGTTWKPVSVLTGDNTEVTVTPYMIWGGAEFDVMQEISAPERVEEIKKTLASNLARVGDKQILDTLITLGGTVGTVTAPLKVQIGAYKGFFEILETILAHAGYTNRQINDGWRPIFPYGFERLLSIDRRNAQMSDTGMGKADIDAELRKIGLGAGVYALDDPTIASTLTTFRSTVYPFVGGSATMSSSTTNTSANVTVTSTATIAVGMAVTGTGIPASTVVSSITSATVFVISNAATATGTPTLTFTNAATQYTPLGLRKWPVTLFDPASVFAGQRGVLSAAVETDATLNRQNRKRYRLEDMEAVGRDGVNAPITLWLQLAPSGTSAIDITYDATQADFSTT